MACVCESEAGVCSPADNAAELQSSCSWKPELQTGGEMAPNRCSCSAEMSETGGGRFIKELISRMLVTVLWTVQNTSSAPRGSFTSTVITLNMTQNDAHQHGAAWKQTCAAAGGRWVH